MPAAWVGVAFDGGSANGGEPAAFHSWSWRSHRPFAPTMSVRTQRMAAHSPGLVVFLVRIAVLGQDLVQLVLDPLLADRERNDHCSFRRMYSLGPHRGVSRELRSGQAN